MDYNYFWEFQRSFCRLKERAEQLSHPFCAQRGVTPAQMKILMALYFEGDQTASVLAKGIAVSGTNLSPLVKKLEGEGLLEKQRHPVDDRQRVICLSPKGKALTEEYLNHCNAELRRCFKEMTPQRAQKILAGMRAMEETVCPANPQNKKEKTG